MSRADRYQGQKEGVRGRRTGKELRSNAKRVTLRKTKAWHGAERGDLSWWLGCEGGKM